jgi:hypothetical protein
MAIQNEFRSPRASIAPSSPRPARARTTEVTTAMLVLKLGVTAVAGIALGVLVSWPAAVLGVAVVGTTLTLRQLRREIDELDELR